MKEKASRAKCQGETSIQNLQKTREGWLVSHFHKMWGGKNAAPHAGDAWIQ